MSGIRLNRIDPRDFQAAPIVAVDKSGREYTRPVGRPPKITRDVRKQIYQLDLTIRESKAEIIRLLVECGVSDKTIPNVVSRIRRERG